MNLISRLIHLWCVPPSLSQSKPLNDGVIDRPKIVNQNSGAIHGDRVKDYGVSIKNREMYPVESLSLMNYRKLFTQFCKTHN